MFTTKLKLSVVLVGVVLVGLGVLVQLPAPAQPPAGEAAFVQLHNTIKPLPGEFSWRTDIPWLTNVQQAREKAAAEGKPILVWVAADGHPLGAT